MGVPSTRWQSVASDRYGIRWVAVEENGYLWISPNGTRGWTMADNLGPKSWTEVTTDKNGLNIVAVGDDISYSRDGGVSWHSVTMNGMLRGVASSARGSSVYAITDKGVFKSSNYGATWAEIDHFTFLDGSSTSKLNTNWKSIATDSTGKIIYAVNNGLWKSNDTHKFRQIFAMGRPTSVATNCDGSTVLAGSKNATWVSFNAGNTFQRTLVAGDSYAMSCNGATMYIASRDGPIWKSNGSAWDVSQHGRGWSGIACNERCDTLVALENKGDLWKSAKLNRVVRLRSGHYHMCALVDNGKVKCWGKNDGQLGYGDTNTRGDNPNEMGTNLEYVDVGGPVVQLRVGKEHTCALLLFLLVKCWGVNAYGELGYGDTNTRGDNPNEMGTNLAYVNVGGTVIQLSLGSKCTCALLDNGKVKCWGLNNVGQLGYGDTNNRGDNTNEMGTNLAYVDVGETVVRLNLGYYHTCALLDNGKVKCWGANAHGQLGYGDTNNRGDNTNEMGTNLAYVDVGETVVQLSLGYYHTCALVDNGKVKCWGKNEYGQLGYGDTNNRGDNANEMGTNLAYVDVGGTVVQLRTGYYHTCALLDNGKAKCWGLNNVGQLGYGDTNNRGDNTNEMGTNLAYVDVGETVVRLNLGYYHTCALLDNGKVKCWGYNDYGQLGECKVCDRGKYGNNSKCIRCPRGSYCKDGIRNPCPLGRYGKSLVVDHTIMEASCESCPTGKFGILQHPDEVTACTKCPSGRYNNRPGLARTNNLQDYCPEGCPAGQYLQGKQCVVCPVGGYCPGGTDLSGVRAMIGFWRVPNTTIFVPCLNPCSCLGAVNPSSACIEAKEDHAEGCNVQKGYRQGSRLCADCLPGYSRNGRGTCKKCDNSVKVAVPILVIFALLSCLVFLVWSTVIKRGGAFKASDGAKKIFISFLQLTSLSMTMDIPWPANYVGIFRAQALVSSVGEEFIDFRCMILPTLPIAQVEYAKMLLYMLLPSVLSFISVCVWGACGKRFVDPKKLRSMMTGTIVLMLYLVYPSITTSALGLWKCEYVEKIGSIFVVDPETLCTDALHVEWVNALAIPSVLVYVVGLPVVAVYFLRKFRHKLDEMNTKIRMGLLYDGYKRENYMHEIWVAIRKVVIIVIGIFTNKLQVLLALGVVAILLTHTVLAQPFQTASLSRLEIMLLSCCFLTLWVGGIFVVYPDCSGDNGPNTVCLIAEGFVLFFNVSCVVIGIGTYVWFSWLQRRDQLQGSLKTICISLSRWRVFRSCCNSGFGVWLRASQATFTENPLSKTVELEEIPTRVAEDDLDALIGRLKGHILQLEQQVGELQQEINKIRKEKSESIKLRKQIKALQKQLADCLGHETKKRERSSSDESVDYLESGDEDCAAVDSKNILNRKRARVQRARNDVVDDDLVQDAEREALTVVKELLENELLAFQAQETIKKDAGDLAMAKEQLREYAKVNNAGLRSRVYGSLIDNWKFIELDQRINAVSAAILLIIQNKTLENVAETLYDVVYFDPFDIRTTLDEENNWELILSVNYDDNLNTIKTRVLSHEEQEAIFKSGRDWDDLTIPQKTALLASASSASEEDYVVGDVESDIDAELCKKRVLLKF
eukprot:g5340.t1